MDNRLPPAEVIFVSSSPVSRLPSLQTPSLSTGLDSTMAIDSTEVARARTQLRSCPLPARKTVAVASRCICS